MRGPALFVGLTWGWALVVAIVAAAFDAGAGSAGWIWTAPALMIGPGLAALVTTRLVDRSWGWPLGLRRWGRGGIWVLLGPLLGAVAVYGSAYAVGWALGVVRWSPGQGSGSPWLLASALGLLGCVGEEIGWRGYLQPRLAASGVATPAIWTGLAWWAFHLPMVALCGFLPGEHLAIRLGLFAVSCMAESAAWGAAGRAAGSLWAAVLFHAFHNAAASGVIPALFVDGDALLLGEEGLLPMLAHLALTAVILWRFRGAT